MFAGLVLEAHVRFDHETGAGFAQLFGERVPRIHVQHRAEVPHRHVVAVHVVRRGRAKLFRRQVCDDLVAVEIEVHPGIAGAAFRATQQFAIERACCFQRMHGKREVEGWQFAHVQAFRCG